MMLITKGDDGLRYMVMQSANAYKDREFEIISQKALERYVENFTPHEQLVWHDGDPIGMIVEAKMMGPFLIEVVKELPDHEINVGDENNPLMTTVKEVWDRIQTSDIDWGASIRFKYVEGDELDGVFDAILQVETSILPLEMAANPFTYSKVITKG